MPRKSLSQRTASKTSFEDENDTFCNVCGLSHLTEYCPLLNSGIHVEDALLPSKALLTLPDMLEAQKSDDVLHIIAKARISKGVQFGPLDAPKSNVYNTNCAYVLKIFQPKKSYFLDTTDESKCNWMTLVPYTTDERIRNCICYQFQNHIYFTTVNDIEFGEPLIVGYSPGYIAKIKAEQELFQSLEIVKPPSKPPLKTYGSASEIKKSAAVNKTVRYSTKEIQNESRDHDYAEDSACKVDLSVGETVNIVTARRSGRKRKAVDDEDFVFESIPGMTKKEPASFTEVVCNSGLVTINSSILEDEDTDPLGGDDDRIEDVNSTSDGSGGGKIKRKKVTKKMSRLGAVLALEEWICKFCGKIELSCSNFAIHLIEHYKSVGAARTEKSRLKKMCTEQSSIENFSILPAEAIPIQDRGDIEVKAEPSDMFHHENFQAIEANNGKICRDNEPRYPYYCDICVNKKVFNRGEYIIRHLNNHIGEINCSDCNQTFSRESYIAHECSKEDGSRSRRSFKCSTCDKVFRSKRKLRLHADAVHLKSFECKICRKSCSSFEDSESHECERIQLIDKFSKSNDITTAEEIIVVRKCELCDMAFPKIKDLEKHLKSHGDSFSCAVCSKVFTNVNKFTTHTSICQSVDAFASGRTDQLKCPKCYEDFEDRDGFRYHIATHTHPAMCPVCNLRLPSTNCIKTHNCKNFICDGCGEELKTLISLKKHITSVHERVGFYCFECALPFVTQDGYAAHHGCGINDEDIERTADKRKKDKRKPQDEGLYVCEVCGATYTKWSSLKTHRYTHGPKRFTCDVCGKSFHRREMLADHEYVHQEAQFQCAICGKKVKSKKSLDVHMQIHKGNKRFQCDRCDKAFCQKINLTTHKLTHLPPEEKGFECQYCDKKFASKEYLGFHIEGHEKGRNEVCDICGRSFVKIHMLNQHRKTAHGNQRYKCEFCNIMVRQKHSLTRHLRKRHKDITEQWNMKGYIESRFVPGDGSFRHPSSTKRKLKLITDEDNGVGVYMVSEQDGDESDDNTLILPKVELLTEVVDVDGTCEVETEEITFATENMIIPENSNMMILQVEEGGEIVLTLAPADSIQCDGTTVVEGMIVEDVNSLQLQ